MVSLGCQQSFEKHNTQQEEEELFIKTHPLSSARAPKIEKERERERFSFLSIWGTNTTNTCPLPRLSAELLAFLLLLLKLVLERIPIIRIVDKVVTPRTR